MRSTCQDERPPRSPILRSHAASIPPLPSGAGDRRALSSSSSSSSSSKRGTIQSGLASCVAPVPACIRTEKSTHAYTHAYMHTCIHTHIHTHTCTRSLQSGMQKPSAAPERLSAWPWRGKPQRARNAVRPPHPAWSAAYVCMYVCMYPARAGGMRWSRVDLDFSPARLHPPPPARGCRSPKTFACTLRFRFLDAASSKNGVLPGGVDASVSGSAGGTSVAHVSAACCSAPLSSLTRSGSPAPAGVEEDRNLRLGTGRLGSERLGMGRIAPREQLDGITRPHSRSGTAGAPAGGRQQEHVEACQQAPTIGW